jgi:PKD repeat protein
MLCPNTPRAHAQTASPILIIEIQIEGEGAGSSDEEFIKLYNTTATDISLTGFNITRKSSACGSPSYFANATSLKDKVIPAHAFFILSTASYKDTVGADMTYSNASTKLTPNNTVLLSNATEIIDKVGYGNACDFETAPVNGDPLTHIRRKQSTDGSYIDTDDNSRDFAILDAPALVPQEKTELIENLFQPQIKFPKNIYQNVSAQFEVSNAAENTGTKYSWNFGDGHKSRLASTSHTYAEIGIYTLTITATASSSILSTDTFTVEVKKLPKTKIVITGINPNPTGIDSDHEQIILKNLSKRKVNLLHWSIATGTLKKTLANHPIQKSIILKPGKEISLANDISAFSLPNKTGFIELRRPDKSVADMLHYTKIDGVKDNERYQKNTEKTWEWVQDDESTDFNTDSVDTPPQKTQMTTTDIIGMLGNFSQADLALLQTRIEEKMQLATTSVTSITHKERVYSSENEIPFHKQSPLRTDHEKILSFVNHVMPSAYIAMHIEEDASLLAKEPLFVQTETYQHTRLPQYINQTLNSFFRIF